MAPAQWSLEKYREYLKLLAEAMLSPDLLQRLDASDVAQEAVVKAHKAMSTFQGTSEGEWLAWLRSILHNTMRDLYRRHLGAGRDIGRERSLQDLDASSARLEQMLADSSLIPANRASKEESLIELAEAVAALPEDQQTAVKLFYLQERPVKKIAQLMNRSEESVGGLLYRGLKALRQRIRVLEA
jgi:RNA polymerase sigma-70 factor (ECF subfamily)